LSKAPTRNSGANLLGALIPDPRREVHWAFLMCSIFRYYVLVWTILKNQTTLPFETS